jgi:hypothetical protein
VSYKEGNKWNRNAYQKCNSGGGGTVKNMEKCVCNRGYYEWLCYDDTEDIAVVSIETCQYAKMVLLVQEILKVG